MSWDRDDLLGKARLFIERAYSHAPDSSLFAFWAVLGLELLARATLANVHPALLADPQQKENLYYALGHRVPGQVRSIPAKTVYSRCQDLIPLFTESEMEFCLGLTAVRNADLHSGEAAFEALTLGEWQAKYFRVSKVLLESMGQDLNALFHPDQMHAIYTMLSVDEEHRKSEVLELVGRAKDAFSKLDANRQQAALFESELAATSPMRSDLFDRCPSCGGFGWLSTEHVSTSDPEIVDDYLSWTVTMLPTGFTCLSCTLALPDYAAMEIAGLGGQRTLQEISDPADYFSLDPLDALMEPEYQNE